VNVTQTSPVTFSSAVATFYEVENNWALSQMIDGIFTGPNGGINGWSVFDSATGISEGADALLTIASPLPAGHYNLTFKIYQNYFGNPGHILGDFALAYTTAASPTLSSAGAMLRISLIAPVLVLVVALFGLTPARAVSVSINPPPSHTT